MGARRPPDVVIKRLAQYLRLLEQQEFYLGNYISSHELGDLAGVTPAQIRKDLGMFGEFGKQGVGYPVRDLKHVLRRILKVDRPSNIAIIGIGELGLAFARYLSTERQQRPRPFRIGAMFDIDPEKIGKEVGGVRIEHLDTLPSRVSDLNIRIAMLTVPAPVAQTVLDKAVAAGIRLFLNFAPVRLKAPEGVRINHADVILDLHQLSFYL